jgi:Tfp pilus assembly protein PilF
MRRFSGQQSRVILPFAVLVIVTTTTNIYGQAVDAYLGGLDALVAGKYQQACDLLGKAAGDKPESAVFQLDYGVALLMASRGNDARDAFARAQKIDGQRADVKLWQLAHTALFAPPAPPNLAAPPPDLSAPYAMKVIVASYGTKSPDAGERAKARTALEEAASEYAVSHRNGIEAATALYEAKRYEDALKLLTAISAKTPADSVAKAYAGHCRLALRDYAGARETYTTSLVLVSTQPAALLGRARCEITMGALDAAEADLALVRRINSRTMAASLAEAEQLLAKAKSQPQKSAGLTNRGEQYTRELCRLELDSAAHPNEAKYQVAISRFFLQPTAVCDLTVGGTAMRGRVPVGKKEYERATAALERAKKVRPNDAEVAIQESRLAASRGQLDFGVSFANPALERGMSDLEMSVGYMQYARTTSADLLAEASRIRNKLVWRSDIRLPNGDWDPPRYHGPSADELRYANELTAKANEFRAKATYAFQVLEKQYAGGKEAAQIVNHRMAVAYQQLWAGDRAAATRTAEEAFAADPLNEHVLRFLKEAYGTADSARARQVRASLDEVLRF